MAILASFLLLDASGRTQQTKKCRRLREFAKYVCLVVVAWSPVATIEASKNEDTDGSWQTIFPDSGLTIPLSGPEGTEWSLYSQDGLYKKVPAHIPGDILSDLMSAGLIDDPYISRNFLTQRRIWMGPVLNPDNGTEPYLEQRSRTWVYTTNFVLDDCSCDDASHTLVLEGIKMGASVSINGVFLANVTDQFLRYEFALDRDIFERGSNARSSTVMDRRTSLMSRGHLRTDSDEPFCERVHELSVKFDPTISTKGRFMGASGGWDWAPYSRAGDVRGSRVFTFGIPGPVYIVQESAFRITHIVPKVTYLGPYARTPLRDGPEGDFLVLIDVHVSSRAGTSNTAEAGFIAARFEFSGTVINSPIPEIPAGGSAVVTLTVTASRNEVELWWPNGMGNQPLYGLEITYQERQGVQPAIGVRRRIGFRTVALVTANDTDDSVFHDMIANDTEGSGDHGMYFRVNGAVVFSRGANVIPMDQLEGRLCEDSHRTMVESAAESNMNMLRVWGGGMVLPSEFYDACDEMGILLYHDLMFVEEQRHGAFQSAEVEQEIRHFIRTLSSHPSIVLWSGCNECFVDMNSESAVYATFVLQTVVQEDTTRSIWPSCPSATGWQSGVHMLNGRPNGKPLSTYPASVTRRVLEKHGPYQHGSSPTYPGINGQFDERPFDTKVPPFLEKSLIGPMHQNTFISEFGISTTSSVESMSSKLLENEWGLHGGSPPDGCHQIVGNDNTCLGMNTMAERNYPCDNHIETYFGTQDLESVGSSAFASQLYLCMLAQALWLKGQIEVFRSQNVFGALVWQLNENWPTGGWGLLEYSDEGFGRWKPILYWLKDMLFQDVVAACGSSGVCFCRNDGWKTLSGQILVDRLNLTSGASSRVLSKEVYLTSGQIDRFQVDVPRDPNVIDLLALLDEHELPVIEDNVILWNVPKFMKSADIKARVSVVSVDDDGSGRGALVVVRSDRIALFVVLTTVVPGKFEENGFILQPSMQKPKSRVNLTMTNLRRPSWTRKVVQDETKIKALNAFPMKPTGVSHRQNLIRELQESTGTCACDDNEEATTIRMLSVGAPDHYLHFVYDRFNNRAAKFLQNTGVTVRVQGEGDLDNLNEEIFADVKARVFDGYVFLPFITGSLVEENGLADLTDFVRSNEDIAWTDVFPFNRDVQAVYDNVVRVLPCDGDVHSMFYRKDLFEEYNVTVPRTWDEYTEAAASFHGMSVPKGDGSGENVTLVGSCVGRRPNCLDFGFFNMLVHSTSTQAGGTSSGALFDPENFDPLMGEAMAETLRHLENQIKYGADDELTNENCSGLNIAMMNEGQCAMTYMWGDSFARHLLEGSVIEGKLGIAPTPGVTKVLDRLTGKLVDCTENICPHGETIDGIGRVNRAPYAAAGGWSVGVSAGASPARQAAMADFFGMVCGKEESIEDVIPFAQGPLFTGTDPYRKSHFNISKWIERGYPSETTREYQATIEEQLGSPNTVLDVRFPEANRFLTAMHDRIFQHLDESLLVQKTHEDRMAVSASIDAAWREIREDFDSRSSRPLLTIYQKSLNVYVPLRESESGQLSAGAVAGIVVGCCAFVAIVVGLLAYVSLKKEKEKSKEQWQIKSEHFRLTGEILGEGSFGVITKGYLQGTPVAVKTSTQMYSRLDSDGDGSTSLSSQLQGTKVSYRQMKEELLVLVKLRNPQIVQTLGATVDRKTVFVVFEFMANGSLASVLADPSGVAGGAGSAFEMQWALQVAKGLEFLHSVNPPTGPLLHEDLKASHVLIDASYNAKLSNFALEARVTGSNRNQGTLLWTAPEVLNGQKPSKDSDVYSYGMLLYEMIARARPFLVRRFSKSSFTEITESTLSMNTDDECLVRPEEEDKVEYFGEQNGHRATVPEIVSRVSDLTLEPPMRPDIPADAPQLLKDLTVECWHKNPLRRPKIDEIVDRLQKGVSPTSLTQQLFQRGAVFDSILPPHVQDALSRGEAVPPEKYDDVTVIFSDIVGFTATCSMLSAEEVGDLIHRLFTQYDELATKYEVKKLDVIGDAFLGVCGIPTDVSDHALRAGCFALEAINAAMQTPICPTKPQMGNISIRFGLASGPVVATVIGSAKHPKYTLFGTTVNTSSRMESSSEPNRVQCTGETADLVKASNAGIDVEYRKKMDIKGRGELDTYFLNGPKEGFDSTLRKLRRRTNSMDERRSSMGDIIPLRAIHTSTDGTSFQESFNSESDPPEEGTKAQDSVPTALSD